MKRSLYVHIGPGKTGTTAIQKFLYDNRSVLERSGVLYPDLKYPSFPGPRDPFKLASHLLAWKNGFGDSSKIEEARKIEEGWFIEQINKSYPKVILSSEYFTGRVTREKILNLKKYIKEFDFDEVKIIYYFRRPDLYIESIYQQSVKNHGAHRNVFESINKIEQVYKVFNLYSHFFGPENMIVRVYEKSQFNQGNIFSDFIQAIGEDWSNNFVLPHKNDTNVGWHRNLILIMRLANENIQNREDREAIRKLMAVLFRKLYSTNKQGYDLLSLDQRKKIESIYRERNAAIAKDYLERPDGALFYESIASNKPECSETCLSVDDAHEIVSYIKEKNGSLSVLFKRAVEKALVSEDEEINSAAHTLFHCFENISK